MLETALGFRGAFTAPHRAAALTGRDILNAGGSAIEAMVAAAATIAVAYPHMNGLGGDAFWIIHRPGRAPVAISGAGRAAALATVQRYAERGYGAIPVRGPDAALVVPGAVATWQAALDLLGGTARFTVPELMADAIALARAGVAVTPILEQTSVAKAAELAPVPGFLAIHQPDGRPLHAGDRFVQPALAGTLERLASAGLDDFYRGDIAATHGQYLADSDSPLRQDDFAPYRAETGAPLSVKTSAGMLHTTPPPTQGVATLMALALFDRLGVTEADGFTHLHGLVEATKRAYSLRNRHVADPDFMTEDLRHWLSDTYLDTLAASIDQHRASPWPEPSSPGDTIWMGASDASGMVVSFIQSLYWEYGSGLTCPATGITFENRGAGFSLKPGPNQLAPGKRPFHTLNPGLAQLNDGRVLAFGTQGGEGQPQTMTAIFSRYAQFGQGLQRAITAPRWLLGTTWADVTTTLKLESRFDPGLVAALTAAGHVTEVVHDFDPMMGQAGAVVHHRNGLMEAATDPRSDGAAIAF
ncbi:gamma-glutamyltransferase family protein [Devosia sp. SL43]|uniref:gamma-glutamyltransferase family protein n=1 Tax=Devosia sp. SL43 TaxID=2806348 RepID=UPI001F1E67D8|nr:gamma-glutamyltransferase [Devosia sp. SL43]UJW85699.1 gamma-glutamyltransferase [Devosia sp. SL43]